MNQLKHIKAVVFDWAGTMIDHGSRAPAIVFVEIFHRQGIEISFAQAREPMGMAKREHIAAITEMPEVKSQWLAKFDRDCEDEDIDQMYEQFLPLQKETLRNHSQLIEGAAEAADTCRAMGLKIGSSTGYTRELMIDVKAKAKEQGYEPDITLCAEDAPRGRPAPYLLFEAAKQLDVFPMQSIVKVDDTILGVEAGVNAGCWSIGITQTGNLLGLSEVEIQALSSDELNNQTSEISRQFQAAGAHLAIDSVRQMEQTLRRIDTAIEAGSFPQRYEL
ncbi:MAG: phosphonoacetaldehyde hydrolase [Planctomycetaceae bacterium]|jgi:phosphonoacetaldehyde hydrolase|nr:phosphonoacetaldehyde hydrolase [Planctomycetaceae bacterium]MBT6724428.1 phosphonoacetaldehyde hydrolase [Planctomycetaceae bacterium]